MNAKRLLVWAVLLAGTVSVGASALWKHSSAKFEAINSYYGKLLNRRELEGIAGPHYWKDGKVFWVSGGYLKSSNDMGATSIAEIALPRSFRGKAMFVSEFVLANNSSVYLRQGNEFRKVLDDFRCWYLCGSRLHTGDFIFGEYGNRIYRVDAETGQVTLLLEKPPETRHFHFTAVDPFTNDLYTSLGDAHKARVTGIMRSQDGGKTWDWLYKTRDGPREAHRQPTAIYFGERAIYFGEDNKPHGISVLHRDTGTFERLFVMPSLLKSWYTGLIEARGSLWALSRSIKRGSFGVLWWSGDGKGWMPIQIFRGTPVWLQVDDNGALLSVGFRERWLNVVAFELPDAAQMAEWVSLGPKLKSEGTSISSPSLKQIRSPGQGGQVDRGFQPKG